MLDRILKLELPTPFPVGNVNAYHIDGTEPVLIDTGLYYPPSLEVLKSQLRERGRDWKRIRRILLTHDHMDHSGAVLHLSQETHATIYAHKKSTILARHRKDLWEFVFQFLRRCDMPEDLMRRAYETFRSSILLENNEARPHSIAWLNGGEILQIDDVSLETIATPGHSPDHLCFYEKRSGALFCGDTLIKHITPNPTLHLDSAAQYRRVPSLIHYINSIQKIGQLKISTGYSGHGKDITDVPGLITRTMDFIRDREALFLQKIRNGARVPYPLALSVFGKLDTGKFGALEQFLSVSETIAYLDLLERDGHVAVDWDADTIGITIRD
jgi:glyoxylase-like metal-dependent hydrolase (beta-lactamase superfamily II)